ncbi:hypothetical protein CALCODRAFT_111348 [Calocera cornea HHB12733]|uniref:Uncharacterized protein n=1 Tax=Calocera cornea HHB12733 TaxID=1353952 RepID=A0A165D1W9_9BASI|nr:hypothetical protein CALCODRAFT_111348 [Calocera cornea HHB12733]
MPTEFVEEPPKKRVKVEKLIRSVTAKNVRKNIESALSYPSVDGVSADDLDADLIAMGVRGKPVESGLGLLPPMPNGHRELLPIMPQPQPEYHQGMASPMHQQQFTHQAPLHIHHIHPPFTHTHQGHTSHLPPPQSQQGMSHHGPPFSAWAPEPQPAFPAHQHHHHSHLQHNHPPPHMQPLPGLPQHMQSQGPPQPPSGHRMNYMPSQSTTHTVMQAVERPPSSHMHVSNNAQPFTMSGPPPNTWNEIRKDRDPAMNSPSGHRHGRRSSPMPPHQSQTPHSHRDQSMFPPQLPPQGPPMHSHGPTQGPPPSHIQSHSARPGPPPPPLEQRRSGEHRSSKSTSSKRKAEDEPDMRREAKRPELSGPSSNSRSTNVSPQDQRRDPARSLPSFSVVPPHQQHTASILKERAQPWDQATNPQQTSGIHNHARHGTQGSPNGPPPNGPMAHNSLPPPSQNRQHNSSSQMYSSSDYGRPQAQKSTPLPSAMFQSHSPSQTMQRPPSMMGTHGRPPSPPPAMRRPNITPPHQHSSHTPSSAAGSRSPGKPAYGPPLPPQSQPGPGTQTPTSAGSSNHLRSSGGPGAGSSNSSRGYGLPKSSSGPSLSTMGPPLPSMNSMNESPRMERPPPSSNSAGPVPPPVPVPVPPPTQLPPVQKYGHGLASRLFPSTGLGGAPAGGRSTSG